MPSREIEEAIRRIEAARSWNERVEEIRRIPERFGTAQLQGVYAAIAEALYVPHLSAHFAYVLWSEKYQLQPFEEAYRAAAELTDGFQAVSPAEIATALKENPRTLLVLRTIVGYRQIELAVAASEVAKELGLPEVSSNRIAAMERGSQPSEAEALACAEAVHRLVAGLMWQAPVGDFMSKMDKPDTSGGWATVQEFARSGVPYSFLLHQRHYGGAFRTLTDATSTLRGEALLENPVETLLVENGIPFIKTGSHNQAEIEDRFNITVRPAPDFVIYAGERTLRALIECKQANDGGTARDKAARFGRLSAECARLGGVPLFAILDGLGWERANDALGPVIRETAGRTFTIDTLPEMLSVEPFPSFA